MRRLSLLLALSLAWLGSVMPFLALELQERGVSGWTFVACMLALPMGRLVVAPMWGLLADHLREEVRVLAGAILLTALGTAALWWVPVQLVVPAMLLMAMGRVGVNPLLDGLTVARAGADYGKLRAWGSVGFLFAIFATGMLRDQGISALATGAVIAGAAVPASLIQWRGPARAPALLRPALRAMLDDRVLRWLLLASALHFAGHATYDGYFAIHLEGLGLGSTATSVAIGSGVAVEIGVLAAGPWLLRRFGDRPLLITAMALAIPRWFLTGVVTVPAVVVALQASHGLTFGLFWVAAVNLCRRRSPEAVRTSAMAVLGASVGGLGALIGNLGGSLLVQGPGTQAMYMAATGTAVLATAAVVWGVRE